MKECISSLYETDQEFIERMEVFLQDVEAFGELDERTRVMSICAALLGCQGYDIWVSIIKEELDIHISAIEIKEILYQACAYLGYAKVYPAIKLTNEVLLERGISLPLPSQSQTTKKTRLEKGAQVQVDIFGDHMQDFYKSGPKESVHINRWLAENCFGDYYTRKALTLKERELMTFCFLSAQGGCEPQLISHVKANLRMGNDEECLIAALSQCLPYIGYPRCLNALRCIKEAA